MPRLGPIRRRVLTQCLHRLHFTGPEARGNHIIMQRAEVSVIIPNPHQGDISVGLLNRILKEAGISRSEWGNFNELAFTLTVRSAPDMMRPEIGFFFTEWELADLV